MEKGVATRWNLSELAPASDADFTLQLDTAVKAAAAFGRTYRGRIASLGPDDLRAAIIEYEQLQIAALKPQYYAHLIFAEDSNSESAKKLSQEAAEAGNLLSRELLFFDLEVMAIPDSHFETLKNDPALLERRMRMRERQSQQKKIILASGIFLTLSFILPGFDVRLGWSQMPAWFAILSNMVVILGYLMVLWVFKTNSYTSRIIEVEAGQKVISTGPYAIVRHPMYVGALLTYAFTPLALGSYWAFIPGVMILPVLILRILDEENLLLRDLPGYLEYTRKVKYRLLPGVW